MQTVLITGASGFLGKACCEAFTAAGYSVRALVRHADIHQYLRPVAQGGIYSASLSGHIDETAFTGGVQAVIHCAYATEGSGQNSICDTNLIGTRRLHELAEKHAVRQFVFISSLASHDGARSVYGTTKWLIEKELVASSDTIVKPATIIGHGGVFENTRMMIRRLPVVPALYGECQLQTVWIGDVCAGLIEIVRQGLGGTIILAHPETVSMQEYYRTIADMASPGKLLFPVPGDFVLRVITVLERMGLQLPVSSENLLGIKYLKYFDPRPDMDRLGMTPQNFLQSLALLKEYSVA